MSNYIVCLLCIFVRLQQIALSELRKRQIVMSRPKYELSVMANMAEAGNTVVVLTNFTALFEILIQ